MQTLVLTVIGEDRTGLVKALADVVATGGGNWERSQLAELAGKFAGIVVVSVPDDRAADLRAALEPLAGLLDVSVHEAAADHPAAVRTVLRIDLLGNDRTGIVREVSAVLADLDLSVDEMTTGTREAPMTGGQLFEAHITAHAPAGADPARIRTALEELARELQVDLTVEGA